MKQIYVGDKEVVFREAVAEGYIKLRRETIERVESKNVEKGDPLTLARLGGIAGSKYTPLLLPLCHNIRIEAVDVDAWIDKSSSRIGVRARVRAHEKTGVEMEALVAAMTALLNIWDMVKQYEKDERGQYPHTAVEFVRIVSKTKE